MMRMSFGNGYMRINSMSNSAHEIDCNCDNMVETKQLNVYACSRCGRKARMVADGPDDFYWEEYDE